mgnify:CR=1 FL=1
MAEMENSKDLISVLWSGADILRSKMDANEYKNYLLGIIFYKYLSDSFLIKVYDMICDCKPQTLKEALDVYVKELESEDGEELKQGMKEECHYVIEPELTYTYFADAARNNSFNREQLQKAFNNIEQSDPIFADLFADIDLYSNRLGTGDQKQSDTVASLIKEIDKADLLNSDAEILGNAYEYLIGQFASETGKKAGEFYTPQAVSKILTRIAISGQEDKQGLSVYDPCMGSGSLLLNAKKYAKYSQYIKYYGQELNTSTYNLARMNMFLHGIPAENQNLRNGDTLDGDWPTDEETDFNMVLMNPPYSAKWTAAAGFLQDERFSDYGVLAPKSKADYAFLLHGLYHLKNNGTMAIVLPHGVLFRGAAEGKIREKLLRSGNIYAVIGLPANLFYNTSIPTCIIVLKKHRDGRDVLFIDASKKFDKGKKQNEMTDVHINEVMELYSKRETVEKESFLASFEEIEKNDFNLNIPRYVDNFEKEEEIDLNDLLSEMKKTDDELEKTQGEFLSLLRELTSTDDTIMKSLDELIAKMEGYIMGRPEIRFKGYTDEWEQRKLGDVAQEFKSGNSLKADEIDITGDYPVYGGNGLRGYTSTYNHDGEYALIGRQGALCGNMNYSAGKAYFTEHAVVVKADENNDTSFLYYMLDTMNLGQYSDQSAQPGLAVNKLVKLENSFPKKEEQQQIGAYFRSLDHLITLHQRKCDEVKSLKKYMLQKMFPQNEQKVPEIRFEGFTEAWEQRKLDDWGTFYYGRSCPKWSVTEDATIPCIRYGELYTKFGAKLDKVYSYTNMSPENLRFSKGTEVLIPRVGEDPMDYNHCTWLSMPDVAIGEMISVFNTDNNPLFTATMFNATLQNEFAMRVEGGSVTNLYFEKLKNIEVSFPSFEEQQKIATYFDSLDNLITLHQRKPISHPNHSTTHTKHKGEEKYVRIRVNDRGKIDRTANLRRFPVDIPRRFKDGGGSVGEFQIYSGAE